MECGLGRMALAVGLADDPQGYRCSLELCLLRGRWEALRTAPAPVSEHPEGDHGDSEGSGGAV